MNKRKIIKLCIILIVLIAAVVRIISVNVNAKVPKVNRYEQGQTLTYNGVKYTITGVNQYSGEQYKKLYNFSDEDVNEEDVYILVDMQLDKDSKENKNVELAFYFCCSNYITAYNIYMFGNLNDLDNLKSGSHIIYPYSINKNAVREEQWKKIIKGEMDYKILIGNYPEVNEMYITNINK